jgi:ACS family glucarate transporter-like MFS transporter
MGWLVHTFGWQSVFYVMGAPRHRDGLRLAEDHLRPEGPPRVNEASWLTSRRRRAGRPRSRKARRAGAEQDRHLACIKQLLGNRMLLGVYIGQYCITTLTYFFLTWFPVYLVQERHMTILKAGFVPRCPPWRASSAASGRLHLGPHDQGRLLAVDGAQDADRLRHAAGDEHDRL